MFRFAFAFGLVLGLAGSARATDDPEMAVKISLSREDPDVRVGTWDSGDPLSFYVFIDDGPTRGGEFGLAVDGAEFESFAIDTERVWISMPMRDPYPGTIAQVIVGPDCSDPPAYLGELTVTPREPGGKVVVDVIPSLRANQSLILDCENRPITLIRGFPATVNGAGEADRPHRVRGDMGETEEPNPDRLEAKH